MKPIRLALAVLAGAVPIGGVALAAGGPPVYDTPGYCRTTVTAQGPFSQEKYDYCLMTEHSSRTRLSGLWGRAPAATRARCGFVSTSSGAGGMSKGSYGVYVTCLEGGADTETPLRR